MFFQKCWKCFLQILFLMSDRKLFLQMLMTTFILLMMFKKCCNNFLQLFENVENVKKRILTFLQLLKNVEKVELPKSALFDIKYRKSRAHVPIITLTSIKVAFLISLWLVGRNYHFFSLFFRFSTFATFSTFYTFCHFPFFCSMTIFKDDMKFFFFNRTENFFC